MKYQTKISTNLPLHGLDRILGMRKESQAVFPATTGQALVGPPAANVVPKPAPTSQVAPPSAPSAPQAFQTGLGPKGVIIKGFIPSPTQDNPDAKLFFKDNIISENGLHGPFNVKGKNVYYPVVFDRNNQQYMYMPLGRAVEAP